MRKRKKDLENIDSYDDREVFEPILGKVLKKWKQNGNDLDFYFTDGTEAHFEESGEQYCGNQCCVTIEDICGDFNDLVGYPLLMAEGAHRYGKANCDSCTWTFYRFATVKGYVTIRWYGESNGYYSETVDVSYRVKTLEETYNLISMDDEYTEPFDYQEVELWRDGTFLKVYYSTKKNVWLDMESETEIPVKGSDLWRPAGKAKH